MDEGLLEPVWTDAPILPPSLVEVLAQNTQEEAASLCDEDDGEMERDEEDEEINFDELFSDDD